MTDIIIVLENREFFEALCSVSGLPSLMPDVLEAHKKLMGIETKLQMDRNELTRAQAVGDMQRMDVLNQAILREEGQDRELTERLEALLAQIPTDPKPGDICVNSATGCDVTGDGSEERPFETDLRALQHLHV